MFEAKSIYLGGGMIESIDCDYNSYKDYGLVCPFCNSPVYLCKGSDREIKNTGKVHSIRPYFSHYATGSGIGKDNNCEKRIATKEGREAIERLKIESKNQKLIFFQNHLLDIFAKTYNVTKRDLRKADKAIGRSYLTCFSGRVNKNFYLNNGGHISDVLYDCIEDLTGYMEARKTEMEDGYVETLEEKNDKYRNKFIMSCVETVASRKDYAIIVDLRQYIEDYSLRLHKIACQEVIDYLCVQPERDSFLFQVLIKMAFLRVSVFDGHKSHYTSDLYDKHNNIRIEKWALKCFLDLFEDELSSMIILLISGVPWLDIMKNSQSINDYAKSA